MNEQMDGMLRCTWDDARRNHLRDGIRMTTRQKVAYFEEMAALIAHFGARDRLAGRALQRTGVTVGPDGVDPMNCAEEPAE